MYPHAFIPSFLSFSVESAILQLTYLRTAAVFGHWIVADWAFHAVYDDRTRWHIKIGLCQAVPARTGSHRGALSHKTKGSYRLFARRRPTFSSQFSACPT